MIPEFLQVLPYKDNGIAADWLEEQNPDNVFLAQAIRQNLYTARNNKWKNYYCNSIDYFSMQDDDGNGFYGHGKGLFMFDIMTVANRDSGEAGYGDGRGYGGGYTPGRGNTENYEF